MTPAQALTITAAGALLIVGSSRRGGGVAEAAEGDYLGGFDVMAIADKGEAIFNQVTEQLQQLVPAAAAAAVDVDQAAANLNAFLYTLRQAEGTQGQADPYAVCYGYSHTIVDFTDHPACNGKERLGGGSAEWKGLPLSDGMCANAGYGPGCVSSAAGAYQLIKGTWRGVRDALRLPDFGPASQDAAALELVRRRGALEDVKAGRFAQAFGKCRNEWASLPGNYARQGQRSQAQLVAWAAEAGGVIA